MGKYLMKKNTILFFRVTIKFALLKTLFGKSNGREHCQ